MLAPVAGFREDRVNLPLRWRTAVVGEIGGRCSGVGLVVVEVRGKHVAGSIELGASGLVVAGQNHVRDFEGNVVEPLLPEVPVRLVDYRDVTAKRPALTGVFPLGQRCVVALRVVARWQLGAGAVVADIPVAFAVENTLVPV